MSQKAQAIQFENIGFLLSEFTPEQLAPVWAEVKKIQADFDHSLRYNNRLAGNLKSSFRMTESVRHVYNLVAPLVLEFDQNFGHYVTQNSIAPESSPIYLKELWVNFQQKHEFNPPHDHYGIISFVIWLQVPYTMEEEHLASPGAVSNNNVSGRFCFQYTNSLGDICSHYLDVDRSMQNKMALFSGKMKHSVFPFYSSEKYRISVAGNFAVKGQNDL